MGAFVSLHGRVFGIDGDTGVIRSSDQVDPVGAKNGATVSARETVGPGGIHKTILTCTATPISISDDAGVAQYGGVKVYDFPAGSIAVHGATVVGNLTGYASLIDTFDGDVALGSATATTGATLTGTEADIMQSHAIAQAVGEVAAVDAASSAPVVARGTAADVDCYLNAVIDDNAAHGAGTATFTGTITLYWSNLG